jgi:hypothetical protein
MIRVLALVYLALSSFSSSSGAESAVLQAISSRLTVYENMSGQFKQEKKLNFLRRPLVSSGSFSLSAEQGLSWLVKEPLRSEMTVRNSQVLLDGKVVQDRGVGQLMAMIMRAFMDGDLRGVAARFTASGELSEDHWQLLLKPKSAVLRSVLSHIELRGDVFLQDISIYEQGETITLIEFSGVVDGGVDLQRPDAAST